MKIKIQYGKKEFVKTFAGIVLVLFIIRIFFPSVINPLTKVEPAKPVPSDHGDQIMAHVIKADSLLEGRHVLPHDLKVTPTKEVHRIWSVSSYDKAFPDMNDVQLATAKKIGIPPLQNRAEAENSCGEHLVYVGISPYYLVKRLNNSIPYLVPRAQLLLNHIGRTFIDSLMVKKIRPSKIIVTSLTRTEEDVRRLQRYNPNATDKSCHFRGTTFDISYSKYAAINDPDSAAFPQVRDDSLKWVLSEVLRDQRNLGLCYVKYEKKQGCFHITVR